mmetsp:Transcript_5857/g.27090  ORF Transcript_5857/g.27090 Transcript_5857/m.27090 type:complete len:383 (+) Transcript_5857:2905-4053(+)
MSVVPRWKIFNRCRKGCKLRHSRLAQLARARAPRVQLQAPRVYPRRRHEYPPPAGFERANLPFAVAQPNRSTEKIRHCGASLDRANYARGVIPDHDPLPLERVIERRVLDEHLRDVQRHGGVLAQRAASHANLARRPRRSAKRLRRERRAEWKIFQALPLRRHHRRGAHVGDVRRPRASPPRRKVRLAAEQGLVPAPPAFGRRHDDAHAFGFSRRRSPPKREPEDAEVGRAGCGVHAREADGALRRRRVVDAADERLRAVDGVEDEVPRASGRGADGGLTSSSPRRFRRVSSHVERVEGFVVDADAPRERLHRGGAVASVSFHRFGDRPRRRPVRDADRVVFLADDRDVVSQRLAQRLRDERLARQIRDRHGRAVRLGVRAA